MDFSLKMRVVSDNALDFARLGSLSFQRNQIMLGNRGLEAPCGSELGGDFQSVFRKNGVRD